MKSLISLLTANTRERLNSKFIFSFVISWAVFNFKGIAYFIFANVPIAKKLDTISIDYIGNAWSWVVPILFAIFYVVALPYIQNYFDKWTAKANIERVAAVNKKELDELNHKINIAEKKIELSDKENEFSTVKKLNLRLDELSIELSHHKNDNKKLIESNTLNLERINELEEYIKQIDRKDISENERNEIIEEYDNFKETDDFNSFIEVATVISKLEELKNIDHLTLERLKANKLIQHRDNVEGKYFDFTKKGSVFWTQYVLSTRSIKNTKKSESLTLKELLEIETRKSQYDKLSSQTTDNETPKHETATTNLNRAITKSLIGKLSHNNKIELYNTIISKKNYEGKVANDIYDIDNIIESFANKFPLEFDEILKKVDRNPFL